MSRLRADTASVESYKENMVNDMKREKDNHRESSRRRLPALSDFLRRLLFFCGCSVYLELSLHFCIFQSADIHIIYPILFGMMTGVGCALVVGLLPRVLRRILAVLLVVGQTLLAEIQLVYASVFGNLMPINQLRMGGGVITEFWDQTVYAIRQNIVGVLLLLLPLVLLTVVLLRKRAPRTRATWRLTGVAAGILILLGGLTYGLMYHACTHPIPAWRLFREAGTSTDQSYRHLGMEATTVQELRYLLFPPESTGTTLVLEGEAVGTVYDPAQWNVIPSLNFEKLEKTTGDAALQALDRYFASRKPTEKNKMTGRLKDYNVIEICAESFSPLLVSQELTPTLYRMLNSGIVFDHYYGCFNSMTTNGEYTLCLGLMPDMTREKSDSSFDESVGNYLPFCLGTCLKDYGYTTLAFHNNNGEFYNRSRTHPNMGYTFLSQGDGLNLTPQRPGSDLEMMEQSVDQYLNSDTPFHAYYMTYSGHYQYNWKNAMSAKHQAEVSHLPYSEKVLAYLACNLELERAMTYLVQRLEEAEKLDKTLIVLTNDHYPYGLTEDEYNELAGHPVDTQFERYHNSFMCYAPGLGETIHVEEYCSTVDILPTVLNLLGVQYDSRLLPGTDVFAPGRHAALLFNGSFVTDGLRFSTETGIAETEDGSTVEAQTLADYQAWADRCFAVSRELLYSDYYAHAFPGHHGTVDDTLPYDDEMTARQQGNSLFIYRKGLMDLYSERYFGITEIATVGEWALGVYRYLDQPTASPDALPPNYPSADEAAQKEFRESPQYQAMCWAFEQGIVRPEDRLHDYRDQVDNTAICLLIYRTREALQMGDLTVDPEEAKHFPGNLQGVTEDERIAVAWALANGQIAGNPGMQDTLFDDIPESKVTRYRLALFLIKLLYPEIAI